jgi:hypothetical protein
MAIIALFLLLATVQTVANVRPVRGETNSVNVNTQIIICSNCVTASGNTVAISGVTQYRDPYSGSFEILAGVKVVLSWWQSSASASTYMGETYSDDSGDFSYTWVGALQPGIYYVNAQYNGGDAYEVQNGQVVNDTYYFQSSSTNAQFIVPLHLSMILDNPTISIGQGDSATVTVTVTAQNSNNAYPVTLSLTSSGQLFATQTFSPQSGSTPFISKLSLNVLNVTQPGTYMITVVATSQMSNVPTVSISTPLQILVQQNTHQISVNVEGLPTNVQTPLSIDDSFIENVTSGTVTLTVSNNATVVSVWKEIVVGDTRYDCGLYSQSISGQAITAFTFEYSTEYRFTVRATLPESIVSTLNLNVNGTDYSQQNIRPEQGFSDFFLQNSVVTFGFSSNEITTNDTVNYKFTGWKDLTTGDLLSSANQTGLGLYQITLTRPYYLEATYGQWAIVNLMTNLPPDVSAKLTYGMLGSANTTVTVPGSTKYEAGEFLVGSTFLLNVPRDQLVLYNAAGDTRYEFQGMSPLTPMTLTKHTTIQLNYLVQYRVLVASAFPSAIVQPSGGQGWYPAGAIATIQAPPSASGQYGIPYVFSGWNGAMSSNETELSFPVTGPVVVEAQWAPNWIYLLIMTGLAAGVTIPSALFVKKKARGALASLRSSRKHVSKKPAVVGKAQKSGDRDLKLYNYIIDRGGSISMKDAMQELGMSKEEIGHAIQRLKESHMLG